MSRSILCAAAAALLASGCAAVPETEPAAAVPADAGERSVGVSDVRGPSEATLVVDAESASSSEVVLCRDMLKFMSNNIVTHCMTTEMWERYKELEARRARTLVRSMQGSAF